MICISLLPRTEDEALCLMDRAFEVAEAVELRLDALDRPRMDRLVLSRRGKLIVTNRSRHEGGLFGGSEEQRLVPLIEAVGLGANYIDVEARTGRRWFDAVAEAVRRSGDGVRLIVSHHDFGGTPSLAILRKRYRACLNLGAHIVKVVTWARSPADGLRILGLIPEAKAEGMEIIAFAMGKEGRMSRIMAEILGSHFSYASLDGAKNTAAGQLPFATMQAVLAMVMAGEGEACDIVRSIRRSCST